MKALAERYGIDPRVLAEHLTRGGVEPPMSTVRFDHVDDSPEAATEEIDRPPLSTGNGPHRYEDLGVIGTGGMGEVRRVRDRVLDRKLAMKVLRVPLAHRPSVCARFVEEAKATAQLQHPGVVPVHDMGTLADGRVWFTMKEVEGRTLYEAIDALHATPESARTSALRSLMGAYLAACETMAYAHERGVLHRDLKPENIMLGRLGELYVVDWGLAKLTGVDADGDPPIAVDRPHQTRMGQVAGTPAYMPPEQARGQLDAIDARTDVYALGAVLYEILAGRPPYQGDADVVLEMVRRGPPVPLHPSGDTLGFDDAWSGAHPHRPAALVEICERAMARDPADRFPSAQALAEAVRSWLDGSRLRQEALEVVAHANALEAEASELDRQAEALRRRSADLLSDIPTWAPETDKAEAWRLADRAEQLAVEAELKNLEVDETLGRALQILPHIPEAHEARTRRRLAAHMAAEASRQPREKQEALLRSSASGLPRSHPLRKEVAAYLRGDGALSLVTDPPGAEVELFRFVKENRRLVEVPVRLVERSPLVEVALPMGSYVAVIRHPDCMDVRYPFEIERCGHWDGVPPDATEPHAIWLPPRGRFTPDERYVPAGWYRAGGDPHPAHPPPVRVWCDAFVVQRFPVTNTDYIAFLDDLVARGQRDRAMELVPREGRGGDPDQPPLYAFDGQHFATVVDADGDVWLPDEPVTYVNWFGARAYLAWLAERTGRPWRLPGELEWEKSARGVDGRIYPWGNAFDPSWARIYHSAKGRAAGDYGPASVRDYPTDCSVYGVRGMAGNCADWCQEIYSPDLPTDGDRVRVPDDQEHPGDATRLRIARGGSWTVAASAARSTYRHRVETERTHSFRGFRGVFSLPAPQR